MLGARPLYASGGLAQLYGKGRNGWSQATAGLASRAMDRSADRVRR